VLGGIVLSGWGSKSEETQERFISNGEMRDVLLGATQGKLRLDPYSGEVFVDKRVDSSVLVNEHDAISGLAGKVKSAE
jgi:hypothetical protein